MRAAGVVGLILLSTAARPLKAQDAAPATVAESIARALRPAMARNSPLRIILVDTALISRAVTLVNGHQLRVGERLVPPGAVVRIEVGERTGDSLWNGALFGGLGGAAVGLTLIAALDHSEAASPGATTVVGYALVGTLVGAAVDGLRGRRTEWRQIWP